MEDNDVTTVQKIRGNIARIGICLLNLIAPGLGLLRIEVNRIAILYITIYVAFGYIVYIVPMYTADWSFSVWLSMLAVAGIIFAVFYIGSIIATWRLSKFVKPRAGNLWRWYSILGAWILTVILSYPVTDVSRLEYRSFWIPSESMLPVLKVGDRIAARMTTGPSIRRGDVVIVRKGETEFIKRVVAIPGDKISFVDGRIILNGSAVAQRPIAKIRVLRDGVAMEATLLEEWLPGERRPHQVLDTLKTPQDEWSGITLGQGQFALFGDNRDYTLDSRFSEADGGLGIVARSQIERRALFRYWRKSEGIGEGAI